jgi:hypothetical protein
MSKTIVTLDNAGMVLRSPKLPAEKAAPPWRTFNDFVRDAEELLQYIRDLSALRRFKSEDDYRSSVEIEEEATSCLQLVARCKAGFELFDRADTYDDGVLKHGHVAKRLGVLIGSFPNANPHAPDAYASSPRPRA